jgi:magnesium chelatase subunit D
MVEFGAGKKASPGDSGTGSEAESETGSGPEFESGSGSESRCGPESAERPHGPEFGAIVGQAEMKEALLAVGASDALDGVVLRGEKGTAKSTAARALATLLPPQRAIADCPYGCPPDDPERQCADCRDRTDPPVEQRPVPFVTLPLGATRERVVGSLSVAEALSGEPEFEPGLLARANRGILYVDEVNLLDDHLVDVLLDAAAAGVNRVERDGVSVTHPAEFTLIGTMNPEEGDLRPQLRDRFALQATVTGCRDLDRRATVVERALAGDQRRASERDEQGAVDRGDAASDSEVREATEDARRRLREARDRLPDVDLPEQFLTEIVELCRDAGVDGHRADIATARTAKALAALDGRPAVIEPDVRRAAELTLPHRLQSTPFEDAPDPKRVIGEHFDDSTGDDSAGADDSAETGDPVDSEAAANAADSDDAENDHDRGDSGDASVDADSPDRGDGTGDGSGTSTDGRGTGRRDGCGSVGGTEDGKTESDRESASEGPAASATGAASGEDAGEGEHGATGGNEHDAGDTEQVPVVPGQRRADAGAAIAPEIDDGERNASEATGSGRSSAAPAVGNRGSRVRTERADPDDRVDAAASVRAAATRGGDRVESRDLRRSVRTGRTGALVVFAVDASASMRGPLRAAKGVALDLLRDAYQQRDEVALVTFAGADAQVVLPPTDSVSHAARHLKELPSGDRTPLPAGIGTASEVLDRADPEVGVVVLVTDGRANAVGGAGADAEADSPTAATRSAARRLAGQDAHVVVVDAGETGTRSLTGEIVDITDAERVPLSALSADRVGTAVERAREE